MRLFVQVERHGCPLNVVSVSYHYKNQTEPVGLIQRGHHSHFIKCRVFCNDIQQLLAHPRIIFHPVFVLFEQ